MKRTATLLFFVCLHLFIQAQDFHTTYSEPEKGSWPYRVLSTASGEFLALKIRYPHRQNRTWGELKVGAALARYDQNMKLLQEVKLAGDENAYSGIYWDLRKIGTRYWFMYIELTKGLLHGDLKVAEVNPSTLELGTPKVLVASIEIKHSFEYGIGAAITRLIFSKTSPNGKHTSLCIFQDRDEYTVSSFDENFDPEWSRQETDEVKKASFKSVETDNAGKIYFSYLLDGEGHVVICSKDKKPLNKLLPFSGEELRDVQLLLSPKGDEIAIAGSYRTDRDVLSGVFKSSISTASNTIRKPLLAAIPDTMVELLRHDGWYMHGNKFLGGALQTMKVNLAWAADETLILTGEFKRTQQGMELNHQFYVSGSILSIMFKDKQVSFARIPKLRVSTVFLTGDSYAAFPYGDKLLVFYNDYPDHLKKDISKSADRADNSREIALVAAVVERNGAVQRQIVADKREQDYMCIPEDIQLPAEGFLEVPIVKMRALWGPDDDILMAKILVSGSK